MNNIQLATTLVAPTGTGKLFVPFSGDANSAVLMESGATGTPAKLKFLRTPPKPTKDFAGVERGEVRLTMYETYNGVLRPLTFYIGCVVPVEATSGHRTTLHTNGALIARDPTVSSLVSSALIPV